VKDMNYLVLVNKENLIDEHFINELQLSETKDVDGEPIMVEQKTFLAYLELKKYLESKNIIIGLNSAFRTLNKQQELINEYTETCGEEYALRHVAAVGASEHHTGLALDLWVKLEGEFSTEKERCLAREARYREVHKYLKYFGFVLRYPKEKENITGYAYEPWHIRYVGIEPACYMHNSNLTLEEFLMLNKECQYKKM